MENNSLTQAICVTADVIDSRNNKKEVELQEVAKLLNEKYETHCITPFTQRMGDELFGVLANYSDAYYILRDLFHFSGQKNLPLYVGIGIGSIFEKNMNNPDNVGGTAVWNSADALKMIKDNDPIVKYFTNKHGTFNYFFHSDNHKIPNMLMNYMTALIFEKIENRTDRQTEIISIYEKYPSLTLEEVGKKLGYDRNPGLNVSKTLRRANYQFIRSAEQELTTLF